jgi:Acyl-CoA thioesterase C-terminal domain/Acyl-CoA thioesterase N-terminal domain
VAPVPTGRIEARAEVLRNGRNTAHVEARIMSEDQTLAVMLGVFGAGRLSEVSIVPEQPRVEMDEGTVFHFLPGDITPNCVQHFEGRWRRGAPPATGDTETKHVVDVRMRDFGLASEYHVLAIADFLPPIAFSLLPRPVTGGSMTWMLELITDQLGGLSLEGWRLDAELVAGRDGYTSQSVMVWGPEGRPIALSHQSMFVFG